MYRSYKRRCSEIERYVEVTLGRSRYLEAKSSSALAQGRKRPSRRLSDVAIYPSESSDDSTCTSCQAIDVKRLVLTAPQRTLK